MAYSIPAEHYDADLHLVPFKVGPDFIAKVEAYKADGFSYSVASGELLVIKQMDRNEPIPATPAERRD